MKFFQRLGRSIMLPVAVLPVAAILVGISQWITAAAGDNIVSTFLATAGGALLDNMALLFAIGISIGMAWEDLAVVQRIMEITRRGIAQEEST